MFCKNCGKEFDGKFCSECGTGVSSVQSNRQTAVNSNAPANGKSKVIAGLLAIMIGFGVYNFYLGYIGKAIAQLVISIIAAIPLAIASILIARFGATNGAVLLLVISVILFLIVGIWSFIEGVMILAGTTKVDGKGQSLI